MTVNSRPAGRRRPTGHHHGDLRNALEQAALVLVAERGPHGFTLAEACRRAGVSVSAPYKHFADRDALLASLAIKGYREQRRRYAAAVAGGGDPAEQLAAFAAAYVRFAAEERALFDITFQAGLDKSRHPELEAAGGELFAALAPVAGRVAPGEAVALDLLVRIAAAAHGLALFLRQGMLPPGQDTLAAAEERAARVARALVEQESQAPQESLAPQGSQARQQSQKRQEQPERQEQRERREQRE